MRFNQLAITQYIAARKKMTKYIFISAVLYLIFILLGIWIGLMLGTYIYNCNY